jgi:hypothetical protein
MLQHDGPQYAIGMLWHVNCAICPSNCADITDVNMQNFCFGVASGGILLNCHFVTDLATRGLCLAMASKNPSTCGLIANTNDRLFCEGVALHSQAPCFSIQ